MFKSYIPENIYQFFSNFFKKDTDNYIIDPLTCLVRLCILHFKPINTKLSIKNNKITYNEPTIFQGSIRWTNGDNREDIHNIYGPILKATQWYSIDNEDIKNIFVYSIKGLNTLKDSYEENSTISHSIQFYINYINEYLGKNEKVECDETNSIFIQLKNLWTKREINIINNMILELSLKECNTRDSLIEALEVILNKKEQLVSQILIDSMTKLK